MYGTGAETPSLWPRHPAAVGPGAGQTMDKVIREAIMGTILPPVQPSVPLDCEHLVDPLLEKAARSTRVIWYLIGSYHRHTQLCLEVAYHDKTPVHHGFSGTIYRRLAEIIPDQYPWNIQNGSTRHLIMLDRDRSTNQFSHQALSTAVIRAVDHLQDALECHPIAELCAPTPGLV